MKKYIHILELTNYGLQIEEDLYIQVHDTVRGIKNKLKDYESITFNSMVARYLMKLFDHDEMFELVITFGIDKVLGFSIYPAKRRPIEESPKLVEEYVSIMKKKYGEPTEITPHQVSFDDKESITVNEYRYQIEDLSIYIDFYRDWRNYALDFHIGSSRKYSGNSIAFVGDSLTVGEPGVSYVDILSTLNTKHIYHNFGKGGDTIKSLYTRIIKEKKFDYYERIVLFVGVNEVYGKITPQHRLLKKVTHQPHCEDLIEMKAYFMKLMSFLDERAKQIIVIPPLILGEDYNNKFNVELVSIVEMEKQITSLYKNAQFLDIYSIFKEKLQDRLISSYLPTSMFTTGRDVALLDTALKVQEKSKERGLHLTLDGVHLNETGAKIVANELNKILKK